MLIHNMCTKTVCPYLHTPQLLREERAKLLQHLQQWEAPKLKTSREIRPPPGRPPEGLRLNVVHDNAEDDPVEDIHDDHFNQIEGLMRIHQTNKYWKAAHKEARVSLQESDGIIAAQVMTLFDTGASSGNFVSSAFVEKYNLQTHLLPVNRKVKVANGNRVNIESKIMLDIAFVDADVQTGACLEFNVMEGLSLDLIIGLPAICNNFRAVLIEMIGNIVFDEDEDDTEHTLHQAGPSCFIDPNVLSEEPITAWKESASTISEEELMIPQPGSVLADQVIERTLESSKDEFLSEVESRIDSGFAQATQILRYLKTEAIDVFVPRDWTGIKGIALIRLEFLEKPPKRMKPASRRIPAAILEATKKEFQRLLTYFYEPSNSSITSPIVIAPKATSPFVRICGDYRLINKLLKIFNFPIPDVIKEMHKAARCKFFIDLDMRNAFHNLRLHYLTSELLSVQTPFGQFQPKFLPEGVAPASGILMAVMSEVFADFSDWLIVIWDNMLLCALDYEDAFAKFQLVIQRCKERNIFLKLSKSWFGFDHAV